MDRTLVAPLAAATLAGFALFRLGLPTGWLVGAMAATALHNVAAGARWRLPRGLRRAGEFLLGASIGSLFTLPVARFLVHHLAAVLVAVGGAILAGLICGRIFLRYSRLDPSTALFATTVGGAAEMASLARLHGGDDRMVAMYHSIRGGLIKLLVPLALSFVYAGAAAPGPSLAQWGLARWPAMLQVLIMGGAGAWAFSRWRLPGGMLVGTIVAIALANVAGAELAQLPREVRYAPQVLIGAAIGCEFDREAIRQMRALLPLQLLNTALLLAMSAGWALLLWAMTPLDWLTALLSTAPAGSVDMTVTAMALGADVPVVASLQALRVIAVAVLMPLLIRRMIRPRGPRTDGNANGGLT